MTRTIRCRFECIRCGAAQAATVPIEEAARGVRCAVCRARAERVFTAPHLNTFRCSDASDENRFALGFSESERTATRRADDAAYEAAWRR